MQMLEYKKSSWLIIHSLLLYFDGVLSVAFNILNAVNALSSKDTGASASS